MVHAVIAAAGKGKRMQSHISKPYIEILRKPILAYTLDIFSKAEFVNNIILVVQEEYIEYCRYKLIKNYNFKKVKQIVGGGQLRQDSIYKALEILSESDKEDIVIIHDGVRPFVRLKEIEELVDAAKLYGAAILAIPQLETVKLVKDGFVEDTLPRTKIWIAKTPQVFKNSIIQEAYKIAYRDDFYGTDDSSLVERLGYKVKIVEGSWLNIKITTPQDIPLATNIIKKMYNYY